MKKINLILLMLLTAITSCQKDNEVTELINEVIEPINEVEILYTMPEESSPHEGTWLQWPHQYQFGLEYRTSLDPTWVAMTQALIASENVHIIAYNETEKNRIIVLLNNSVVALTNIDFKIYNTDDVWVRDSGPIYVRDKNGNLVIEDWGFNAWGNKIDDLSGLLIQSNKCDAIPSKIANDQDLNLIDINTEMINEGGSVEIDGHGTLMACKSSILNENRNPGMTQEQAEMIFKKYLGVTNFIWLDGQAGLDITDGHIDGVARFGNSNTIVTMEQMDLLYYYVQQSDIDKLYSAKNKNGTLYTFLKLPLTQNDVVTTNGTNLGYKGSYVNFYTANTRVLVPTYNDPNDAIAIAAIQSLYPNRTVVGIDARNLFPNGGMIHCVTQQQPKQ
jgi:agmatine deiminase